MTPLKKIGYFLYLCLSVTFLLGAGELAGRIYVKILYGVPGKTYGIFQKDPELRMAHRPNSFNTRTSLNNYGFRTQANVPESKASTTLRIIAFGGSSTFGYNLSDGETYPEQLELAIRKIPGYEKTEVFNAGVICYSAGHNRILIKRLLAQLKPDYVIIYEGPNEIMNAWVLKNDGEDLDNLKKYGIIGKSYSQANWLLQNSVLAKYIDYSITKMMEKKRTQVGNRSSKIVPIEMEFHPIHPWIIENYKYLLSEILTNARNEKSIPIVLRYASRGNPYLKFFSDLSAQIAKKLHIPVCDMQSAFESSGYPMKDLFIYTGLHPTPQGAKILAQELLKTIMEQELVRKPILAPVGNALHG